MNDLNMIYSNRSMKTRTETIVSLLNKEYEWMSAREIANKYLTSPSTSDVLTTGTICNVLSFVNIVERREYPRGQRSFRVQFRLKRV